MPPSDPGTRRQRVKAWQLTAILFVLVAVTSATVFYLHRTGSAVAKQAAGLPANSGAPLFRIVIGKPGSPYPYSPATLHIPAGRVVAIDLTDNLGGCALVTVFPRLGAKGGEVRAMVPVGTTRRVYLKAATPGRYPFHCSENMYKGTLVADAAGTSR